MEMAPRAVEEMAPVVGNPGAVAADTRSSTSSWFSAARSLLRVILNEQRGVGRHALEDLFMDLPRRLPLLSVILNEQRGVGRMRRHRRE
jgi:hypothetical protein